MYIFYRVQIYIKFLNAHLNLHYINKLKEVEDTQVFKNVASIIATEKCDQQNLINKNIHFD